MLEPIMYAALGVITLAVLLGKGGRPWFVPFLLVGGGVGFAIAYMGENPDYAVYYAVAGYFVGFIVAAVIAQSREKDEDAAKT